MSRKAIPEEVRAKVEEIVARYNEETFSKSDVFYAPRFRGKYCYLYRSEFGCLGPICRLTYTGDMENWDFAIFKWSSETYDPDEWMFPGSNLVDGTVEGAMAAGLEAYRV
jgi:hypothetical protein